MAINIAANEQELLSMKETLEGNTNSLILTDKKLYCEVQKSGLVLWLSAVIFSFFNAVGLGLMFTALLQAHRGTIMELDKVDSIDVIRKPKVIVAVLGFLVIVICFFFIMKSAGPMNPISGKDLFIVFLITFVFIAILIISRRSMLVVYSANNHCIYNSAKSMEELEGIRDRIFSTKVALQQAASAPAMDRQA